jgi:hypothetical protein
MTTALGRMSVRSLLLGSNQADAGDLLARSVEDRGVGATVGAAVGGLTKSGQHAVCDEVGHVANSLLDLDMTDVLIAAWRKQADLVAAGRRTAASPGSEELVHLAAHRITSKHQPHVDVYVDDVRVTKVEMELALSMLVRGMLGVVAGGRLMAIRAGSCEVTGSLACEHVKLVERKTVYDLSGEVHLGEGMDLVPPE